MCKAIQDLMEDSRLEGIELGIELTKMEDARNLLDVLTDDVIADKIGLSLEVVRELRAAQLFMLGD